MSSPLLPRPRLDAGTRRYALSIIALAGLVSTAACSTTLNCPESIDAYCASSPAPECTYREYQAALWEWNQEATSAKPPYTQSWGCGQTDNYEILSVDGPTVMTTRYFSRSSGKLVAILSNSGNGIGDVCVAGPPLFTVPPNPTGGGRCGYGISPFPPDGAADAY
jgi:hypothetical protein